MVTGQTKILYINGDWDGYLLYRHISLFYIQYITLNKRACCVREFKTAFKNILNVTNRYIKGV